ncbi:hypothetical protein SRHO_G00315370 [Serrasalmus rhombeus]
MGRKGKERKGKEIQQRLPRRGRQLRPSEAVVHKNEVQIVCSNAWSCSLGPLIARKPHHCGGTSRNTLKGNERSVRRGSCRGTAWHRGVGESFQRDGLVICVEEPEGVEFNNVTHGNSC